MAVCIIFFFLAVCINERDVHVVLWTRIIVVIKIEIRYIPQIFKG